MSDAAAAISGASNHARKSLPIRPPRKVSDALGVTGESSGSGDSHLREGQLQARSKDGETSTFRTNYSSKETMAKNPASSQEATSSLKSNDKQDICCDISKVEVLIQDNINSKVLKLKQAQLPKAEELSVQKPKDDNFDEII